jgi:hypothetical protein
MIENPYDLFGEVPVYTHDIALWLVCVPKMDPGSPRAHWYTRGWDVAFKIRRAKINGEFGALTPPAHPLDRSRWAFMQPPSGYCSHLPPIR